MTRLKHQPWLDSAATVAVMDALEAAGGAGCARFVGGCVRNALMGQPVDDLDIATRLTPDQSMQALQAAGLKVVPTGVAHGTVTAVSGGRPYEITTLRRDVETDGRRAVVAFTEDWVEDAARRDFRLNALYADRSGQVFDPTGEGVADAAAGRVVFVGDAEARIREDYLRILRFFRFFAWYGREAPDAEGLAACARLSDGVERLSAERVSKELLKLLAAPDPRPSVSAMKATGVLARVLPGERRLDRSNILCGFSPDPELRLAALLQSGEAAQVAVRLRLSNALRDRLVLALQAPVDLGLTDAQARAGIYAIGAAAFRDRVRLARAVSPDRVAEADRLIDLADSWTVPRMPIGGREIARLGVAPGPATGRLLKAFEAQWIAADFPETGHQSRLEALAAEAGLSRTR